MYIYICIYTNSTMKFLLNCFINNDFCAKAMEPAVVTLTLYSMILLVTKTILLAYLKNISKNYL